MRDPLHRIHLRTSTARGTLLFIAVLALLLSVELGHAAIPPAGTLLVSRSTAEFRIGPEQFVVNSNSISTTVAPVYAISLDPHGSVSAPAFVLQGFEGDTLYGAFTVGNGGNARDSLAVGHIIVPPSTIGLSRVIAFGDANGNGRLDSGEDDPTFLAFAAGETIDLRVAFVLTVGQGVGESYVEIRAASVNDSSQVGVSVVRVSTRSSANMLHIGPGGNATAMPGGEGSSDDVLPIVVGYTDNTIDFRNDITNAGGSLEFVQLQLADSLPPGMGLSFRDTTGTTLQPSPIRSSAFLLGVLGAGETRSVVTRLTSTAGPFHQLLADSLSLRIGVQSLLDTFKTNTTVDRVLLSPPINPAAVITLEQTFDEHTVSFGDIVTLVVTVANTSDSVAVDSVIVYEDVQPALGFLSSPTFERHAGRSLAWKVGGLSPGEKRETVIKFTPDGRVSRGRTKVFGRAQGIAVTNDFVFAGPVINVLRVDNDLFAAEGIVLGDVFFDANENGKRDAGEAGVPNVAVYTESGEYALCDSSGRFSMAEVFPGYRVFRIDESTLPANARLQGTAENGGIGWRLVHLLPSGHATLSFPVIEKTVPPVLISRGVYCHELKTVQKQARVLYQAPSVPSSFFEIGQAYLKTNVIERLNPIVDFLSRNPDWVVFLEGHTDSIPMHNADFASNDELSVARAKAVMTYLVANGVSRNRIVVRGYGDRKPIATNATVAGRARNRRVEVGFMPASMGDTEEIVLQRINADVGDLSTVPDSFLVRITWDISTDSPRPLDADFSVELPATVEGEKILVSCGGEELEGGDARFLTSDFVRSRALHCEVAFRVAARDTALIRDIEGAIRFSSVPPGDATTELTAPSAPLMETFRLRPFDHGALEGDTRQLTLASWQETRGGRAESANAMSAVAEAAVSDTAGAAERPLGLTEPDDGTVFTRRDRITVSARVPLGSQVELICNDEPVPDEQIGQKVVRVKEGVEDITFYGVKIESGWNDIAVRATRIDGSTFEDSLTVALSSRPSALEARRKRVMIPANGVATDSVRVAVLDVFGLAAVDGLVGTVVEGDTLLRNTDERLDTRGLQVTSQGGHFVLHIRGRVDTGKRTIVIESGALRESIEVTYVPPRRPMYLSGIVGLRLGAFEASGRGSPLGLEHYTDDFQAKGESRLFLQGTTFGGMNLTARLDSRKRYRDPLLKTMNPERQYSIYGDASELHFAAPAEGGNYVALEKGESFIRYGDFRSPLTRGEFLAFRRTSSGLNGALASGDKSIKAFVVETGRATFRDEIPGDGTSGFYYLRNTPIVENSVVIRLETRDRFQLEKVLDVRPLVQFRDYTVNYFNGSILFKSPVPVMTNAYNPVTIVAIYEVETDRKAHYLYGVRGDVAQAGRARLGATAVSQGQSQFGYALYGADGGISLAGLDLSGEFARSEDDLTGNGTAYKVGLAYKNRRLGEHSIYYRDVSRNFANPSFTGGRHERFTRKAGFDSRLTLTRHLSIQSNAFRHELSRIDEKIENAIVVGRYQSRFLSVGAGGRVATQEDQMGKREAVLSVVGAGIKTAGRFEIDSHYEKNHGEQTVDEFPDRLNSRLALPFFNRFKLVLNHEHLSAAGRPATDRFVAGVESKLSKNTTAYTKYRMNRTAGDERMGALTGLRQKFSITSELRGSFDLEGFRSFSETLDDEYVAMRAGLRRLRRGLSLIEGQYEYRWQRSSSRHLVRLNAVRQFDNGFAVIFKDAVSLFAPAAGATSIRSEGRLGGVYRPRTSRLRTLFLLRNEYDRYSPVNPDAITWKMILSTDINVIPAGAHELRLKLAMKRVEDYSFGFSETSFGYLVLSQYVFRFWRNWDVDLWGRYLDQHSAGTGQLGSGVELGRLLFNTVRVSAGYSFEGLEERDLSENDAWAKGFGLRVQFILSDWILNELGVRQN